MKFRCDQENSWFRAGPVLGQPVNEWRYVRPVIELSKCNNCGWCDLYCPTGCISEEEDQIVIHMDYCKGCGICANECPKDAITMIDEEEE